MLALLLACTASDPPLGGGSDDSAAPDDSAPPDDSTPADSAPDDSAPPHDSTPTDDSATPGVIAPATDGTLRVPFDVAISGAAAPLLDTAAIAHAVGPITVFGESQRSLVWIDQAWSGITLYFTLSIPDDGHAMNVTYFYCYGDDLGYVYALGFGEPLAGATATGKCPRAETPIDAKVSLPALTALPEPVATDIDVDGDAISIHDGRGTLELGGATYDVTTFGTVDCSDCGAPGWYELHSVLVGAGDACYGVLYLFPDTPDTVQLGWTICVPSLTQPDAPHGVFYDAKWSGSFPSSFAPVAAPSPWHAPPGR
jgi:hypothetical protein